MPKLPLPIEIIGVVSVSPEPVEKDAVTLLVQAAGGLLVLKMTPDVATAIYKAVCEEGNQ